MHQSIGHLHLMGQIRIKKPLKSGLDVVLEKLHQSLKCFNVLACKRVGYAKPNFLKTKADKVGCHSNCKYKGGLFMSNSIIREVTFCEYTKQNQS